MSGAGREASPAAKEVAVLMAEVRKAEDIARLEGLAEGFETCEGLVAEMLEAMAEDQEGRAALYGDGLPRLKLVARAGALREAALAVRLGQARAAGEEGGKTESFGFAAARLVDPRFKEAGSVHDWRNYISEEVRGLWPSLPMTLRAALARQAEGQAQAEEWE